MSSTPQEVYASSLTVPLVIVTPIATLSALYLVYGLYVILFGTCIYMMRRREKVGERFHGNIYLVLTVVLFVLATIFVVVNTINLVRDSIIRFTAVKAGDYGPLDKYFTHDTEKTVTHSLFGGIPVLLNIAAEWMLIHRCYLIWGSSKRVAVPLIVTSVIVNAMGLATVTLVTISISDSRIPRNRVLYNVGDHLCLTYDISSAVNNLVLTSLTAGRIWWIRRQGRAHGIYTNDNAIETVAKIMLTDFTSFLYTAHCLKRLESGMLYPITMSVDLIIMNTVENPPFDLFPICTLCAGIAPTLMMVRAKLSNTTDSLKYAISEIHFTTPGPVSQDEPSAETSQTHAHTIGAFGKVVPGSGGGSEERLDKGKEVIVPV